MSESRMTDPVVRLRVAIMTACLITLAWVALTVLGRPAGPFARSELPDVAGLPIRVPQIENLVPPQADLATPSSQGR